VFGDRNPPSPPLVCGKVWKVVYVWNAGAALAELAAGAAEAPAVRSAATPPAATRPVIFRRAEVRT
jgi:hypothetical protein